MSKHLFTGDFEINASKKMLYPYLSSPSGLSQWFADDVTVDEDKVFNFIWEGEDHKAALVSHRTNGFVKFEFVPETDEDKTDPAWFEIKIEENELTQTVFLQISDYSDMDDDTELHDMWSGLIDSLKEIVGG